MLMPAIVNDIQSDNVAFADAYQGYDALEVRSFHHRFIKTMPLFRM